MNELLPLIKKHLIMVARFRWIALGSAVLISLAGWTVVQSLPNRYEATTKLFFDSSSILQPLLKGLALENVLQLQLASIRRALLQRKNLEALAREVGLLEEAASPIVTERALTRLISSIQISQDQGENVFSVAYQDVEPKRAAYVLQRLIEIFIEESLGENRIGARQSQQFLDEQIREYRAKLEFAEAKLRDFKQRHFALLSGGESYFSRLEALTKQIDETKLQLKEAQSRRGKIQDRLAEIRTTGTVTRVPVGVQETASKDPLDVRIANMQENLDELLSKYTNRHPEVVYTQRTLDQLLREKVERLQGTALAGTEVAAEPIANPVYQNLKTSLTAADTQIAAIQTRLGEYRRRADDLKEMVDSSLKVEADYQKLNRDYAIDKSQYDEFIKRRELLNVTVRADDFQIRILEPPREPAVPAGPRRKLLILGVLLAGAGVGTGLAWLLAMLRPVVYTKEEVGEVVALPVLGTVSMIRTPAGMWLQRFQHLGFVGACISLLIIGYGVAVGYWLNQDTVAGLAGKSSISLWL